MAGLECGSERLNTMARHVDGSLPYRALRPHGRSARRARHAPPLA